VPPLTEKRDHRRISAVIDGTIPGIRRLGTLSVPFRLPPSGKGGSIPKWVPIRTAVTAKPTSSAIFSGQQSGNLALGCYDRAPMVSGDNRH
jgi:hypothetical protein